MSAFNRDEFYEIKCQELERMIDRAEETKLRLQHELIRTRLQQRREIYPDDQTAASLTS